MQETQVQSLGQEDSPGGHSNPLQESDMIESHPLLNIHHTQYPVNAFFLKEQWLWSSFHTPDPCFHSNPDMRRNMELSYMYMDDVRK